MPESFKSTSTMGGFKNPKDQLQIKVEDLDNQRVFIWSIDKFKDKLDTIKDFVMQY